MIALDIRSRFSAGRTMGEDICPVGSVTALETNVPVQFPTRMNIRVDRRRVF